MEMENPQADRPNGWDAKPALGGHLAGIVLVMTLWSVFGLAFLALLLSEPGEISPRGNTVGRVVVLALLAFAWGFFGMHARSLLLVRRMTRDMGYKPFENMRPGEVIAMLEEHLSTRGLPYRRLSQTGGMPREYVPGSMRYLEEILDMEAVGARIVVQPFSHADEARGLAAFTPVFLGPLRDDNRSVVQGLMEAL